MFAIRARRKTVTEKDFLEAVNKVSCTVCLLEHALSIFHHLCQQCTLMGLSCTHLHVNSTGSLRIVQVIKGYQKFSATPKYMVYN